MPKYLAQATYSMEGLAESLGGKVEAFYYAMGDHDVFVVFDLPDKVSITTASMVINASGASRVKMTVLLTPEEIDEASKKSVTYFPPWE